MLYQVPGDRLMSPEKIKLKEVIQAVERKAHHKSLERMVKTYEEAVEWVVQNGGKLQWTKTGVLLGHGSKRPHKDVEHVWATIVGAVGDDRLCLIAAGTYLQLIIARRPETWLCISRETGSLDPLTGDPIFAYEYWVDNSYAPPAKTVRRRSTVNDLAAKWGTTSTSRSVHAGV